MATNTAESAVTTRKPNRNPTADFIKSSCRATLYPAVCVQSLLGYANAIRQSEEQLVLTALSVSISRTQSCASFVRKVAKAKGIQAREHRAVQDCVENMDDSVDRLGQSAKELGLTGRAVGEDFAWHMSNVQTWVSAAMTYQSTCLDGFAGPYYRMDGRLKNAIRARAVDASQVTSNALALVNRFASRRLAAATHTDDKP